MLRVQTDQQEPARAASAHNWLQHKMAFVYFKVTLKSPEAAGGVFLDTLPGGMLLKLPLEWWIHVIHSWIQYYRAIVGKVSPGLLSGLCPTQLKQLQPADAYKWQNHVVPCTTAGSGGLLCVMFIWSERFSHWRTAVRSDQAEMWVKTNYGHGQQT